MNEDQLAIIGFVCLAIIIGCLYFSVEISNWLEKKREQRLKAKSYLTSEQIAEKEKGS